MIITKPVKSNEIESGDIIIIREDYREEFFRKHALKVIDVQSVKENSDEIIVASERHSGLVRRFSLNDIFTVIKIVI